MTQTEALKLALEALENIVSAVDTPYRLLKPYHSEIDSVRKLIPVIKEALAQQCVCGEPNTAGTHRTDGPCLAPQPEQCKYGQEPRSCTSSPMDCQCALDATFAQPEQEPVFSFQMELHAPAGALIHPYPHVVGTPDLKSLFGKVGDRVTFYTTPPQRKPLTDEQIWEAYMKAPVDIDCHVSDLHKFARAIEAAHSIKD